MPFHKGESGNPAGRPLKSRTLSTLLEQAGNRGVDVAGKRVAGKRVVADLLWQAATTARADLPTGEALIFSPRDWFEAAKFLFAQIDGPPKAQVEMSGPDGDPLVLQLHVTADTLAQARARARAYEDALDAGGGDA